MFLVFYSLPTIEYQRNRKSTHWVSKRVDQVGDLAIGQYLPLNWPEDKHECSRILGRLLSFLSTINIVNVGKVTWLAMITYRAFSFTVLDQKKRRLWRRECIIQLSPIQNKHVRLLSRGMRPFRAPALMSFAQVVFVFFCLADMTKIVWRNYRLKYYLANCSTKTASHHWRLSLQSFCWTIQWAIWMRLIHSSRKSSAAFSPSCTCSAFPETLSVSSFSGLKPYKRVKS